MFCVDTLGPYTLGVPGPRLDDEMVGVPAVTVAADAGPTARIEQTPDDGCLERDAES
jgi:hypothetical protein